jgi:HEAT repeat protein
MKQTLINSLAALSLAGTALAQTPAEPMGKPLADEELALAALEGLMSQSPERALPILKRVLAGSQSKTVKQRALFVLSQIESTEANEILLQTARSTDPDMRNEAIRNIGIGGDPKSLDALLPIYAAGDKEVRKKVLEALMIAERKEAVYQIALTAKTEDDAAEAIRMLGVMGATEELRKLGDKPNSAKGLIDAYAISGDLASLRKIAEGNSELSVRVQAVRQIGIVDGDASRAALREIYTRSTDASIKDAALQGMLIADDDKGVLALYQAAKTPDEKRTLLRTLMTMDGDVALQAIDSALEKK